MFGTAWFVFTALWLLFFFALYLVYLPLRYHSISYSVEGQKLVRRGGVLYSCSHSLAFENIQYVAIIASPMDRIFSLRSLVIVVPGGRLTLSGLTPKKANDLASVLASGTS